jgi:hypothetical protein
MITESRPAPTTQPVTERSRPEELRVARLN